MDQMLSVHYIESYDKTDLKDHFHNSHELILVCEGSAVFKIGGREYIGNKGSLMLISNHESHEITVTELPYKRYYVLIDPGSLHSIASDPVLGSLFKYNPEINRGEIKLDESLAYTFQVLLKAMLNEQEKNLLYMTGVMSSLMHLLIIKLYRHYPELFPLKQNDKNAVLISSIQSYIEQNCEKDITLSKTAKEYYLNASYLSHIFKKYSGYNFRQYLILQRLSLARKLLVTSETGITQISEKCGFGNVNHFIRMFGSYEGITPYQYRKKALESAGH